MHLPANKFNYKKETKTWISRTTKLNCSIPSWSPLFPGEVGEIGIFFYVGFEADIHKYVLHKTVRNSKHDIDYWELYPTPEHKRDFKLKGYKMIIYNDEEQIYA